MDKTKTKNTSGGEFIRHSEGSGWAPVPRKAFDDTSLSIDARGCLAWLLTRPDGHRLFVRYAQQRLGISQGRWQRIRRELEASRYLIVQRGRGDDGSYVWRFHIFDSPEAAAASIGGFTIGRFSTDGLSTGGKPADKESHKQERHKQERKKEENNAPKVRTQPTAALTAKAKNNHHPRCQRQLKAKASPKNQDQFIEQLTQLSEFQEWMSERTEFGRQPNAWRLLTHVYPSLRGVYETEGWEGVCGALETALTCGYESFAHVNGGEVGEVVV